MSSHITTKYAQKDLSMLWFACLCHHCILTTDWMFTQNFFGRDMHGRPLHCFQKLPFYSHQDLSLSNSYSYSNK